MNNGPKVELKNGGPTEAVRLEGTLLDIHQGQLAEAEAWLLALHAANERHGVYPRAPGES